MAMEAKWPDPYFPDDDEVKTSKKEVPKEEPPKEVTPQPETPPPAEEKPGRKKKYSTIDGPRYTVGMRSDTDPCCYKDFFETEKLSEAKEKCDEAVAKYGKCCIVWDRLGCPSDVYRVEPPKGEEPMVAGKVSEAKKPAPTKRPGKKK